MGKSIEEVMEMSKCVAQNAIKHAELKLHLNGSCVADEDIAQNTLNAIRFKERY